MAEAHDRPADPNRDADFDVEDELALALQELEQRGEVGLEEFLRARPDRAQQLRDRLAVLQRAGVLTPPPPAPESISQYGEFRVIRRVASGGMGVVYLAQQLSLQRQVALKVVRPEFLLSEHARERFQREVETVARLSHPGIVPILAVGLEGTVPWFAMEYVNGMTLDAVIDSLRQRNAQRKSGSVLRAVLTESSGSGSGGGNLFAGSYQDACVRIVLQVADAMTYVHARGIVHRDLKPSNIMVTAHDQALVLDFGLAHVQDRQRLTQLHTPVGSPAYMAPEQLRGEAVDERVDVYGLGVILYELLALRPAFSAQSAEALQQEVVNGTYVPLHRGAGATSRDLATVVGVAIDRDRARRYRSMQDFAHDLERVLQRQPIRARPLTWPLRLWRMCQRHPVAAVVAAALLFLLLQFPLVLWWMQARANTELVKINQQLVAARASEAAASREAKASLDDAYVAIHDMLAQTGSFELRATPGGEQVRIALLTRAMLLYDRLAARRSANMRLTLDAARTQTTLGTLYENIGDWRAAEFCYDKVLRNLARAEGDAAATLRGIAGKLKGVSLNARRQLKAAEAVLRQAECELRAATAVTPSQLNRLQLAEVQNSLALVLKGRGQVAAGNAMLESVLRQKQAVLAEDPTSFEAAKAVAISCANLAKALGKPQLQRALELIERGVAALQAARCEVQNRPLAEELLSSLYDQRGILFNESGKQQPAEQAYWRALALRIGLATDFPYTADYAKDLGATYHNLAMTFIARQQYERALEFDQQSIVHQRRALEMAPHKPENARFLEYALVSRCVALLSLDRLAELDSATGELGRLAVTAQGMLNAARLRIHHGKLDDKQQGGRGDRMRQEAAELVAKAIDSGFRNKRHFTAGRFAKLYQQLRGMTIYDQALAKL